MVELRLDDSGVVRRFEPRNPADSPRLRFAPPGQRGFESEGANFRPGDRVLLRRRTGVEGVGIGALGRVLGFKPNSGLCVVLFDGLGTRNLDPALLCHLGAPPGGDSNKSDDA